MILRIVFLRQRLVAWTRTIVADGHKFRRKASEPETSRPVEKCNFYRPHLLHLAPPLAVIPSEFCRYLLHHTTRVSELSGGVVYEI